MMHVLSDREKLISKFNMNIMCQGKAMSYKSIFCCQQLDVNYRSVTAAQFTVPQNDRPPANCVWMRGPKIKCEFVLKEFRGVYFFVCKCLSFC